MTLVTKDYELGPSGRVDNSATADCPINKENNLETVFAPTVHGINPNGDTIPCISKHLAVTNTYTMDTTDTEYIIVNPNTHSDIMGYRYRRAGGSLNMIATLKSPFNHTKYRLSKMVSSVIYCKSDTQSTTNVALSGVMSSMIMYDLPTFAPEFEELTRMSLLPTYGIFNVPLWTGTRTIFPPIPRKFSSGDSPYLSLSEASEHEKLASFTVARDHAIYTYNGGFYTVASPLWVLVRPIVHGQTGVLRITKDGDGQDYPFGPYGYSTSLYIPRTNNSSIITFENYAETTEIEITIYSADPLLAPDMDPKLFMAITGTAGPRNIVLSGSIRKQLVPTNDMLEITSLTQPYSYDPSVFEAANMLLAGPIPAVAPFGEIPIPTMEEAATLSTGHCSLATFAKTLIGGIKTLGISPANILRKGISWLSGLANRGVDMAERSGYASREYETDPPQFVPEKFVGSCTSLDYSTFDIPQDEEVQTYIDFGQFRDEQEEINVSERVDPTPLTSDVGERMTNYLKDNPKDFPDKDEFAKASLMKQSGAWLKVVSGIGSRVAGTSGDNVAYQYVDGSITTYQPFLAVYNTRVQGQNPTPFMGFIKLTLSDSPPTNLSEYHQPMTFTGTVMYLSKKMATTEFGSVAYQYRDQTGLKPGRTVPLPLNELLLGVPEWQQFFTRCRRLDPLKLHIIIDFNTGPVQQLVDASWLGALHACMFGTSPTVCFLSTISNLSYLTKGGNAHPLSVLDNVDFSWKVYINNPNMRDNYPSYWPTTHVVMAAYSSPSKFASFSSMPASRNYTYGWGYPSPDSQATIFLGSYDFNCVRRFGLYKYVSGFMPKFKLTPDIIMNVFDSTPQSTKDITTDKGYTPERAVALVRENIAPELIQKINDVPAYKQQVEAAYNRLSLTKPSTYRKFWHVFLNTLYNASKGTGTRIRQRNKMALIDKLQPKQAAPPKKQVIDISEFMKELKPQSQSRQAGNTNKPRRMQAMQLPDGFKQYTLEASENP